MATNYLFNGIFIIGRLVHLVLAVVARRRLSLRFCMAERRNRRSSLDTEEETKHPSRMSERNSWKEKEHQPRRRTGHYDEFSASGTTGASDPTDNSGFASWDLIDEKPIAPKNNNFIKSRLSAPEGKEIGGRNRYNMNVSPGFDGIGQHNYNHSLENDRTRPHRYVERGGTRSRSRSRTRGRSRSRSLSRGRERERSRSRGDRSARDRASPRGDYRPQSYEQSERRTEPGKSSQICRNFTAGRCMRGSQCRFIHPDDTNRRDRNLVEDRSEESLRNRSDHENRTSTHSYGGGHRFEPCDDVYHGDTEQFHSKARSEIPCNNFLKGKCDWGDSCKFSHHFASDDNNSFDKGNRNTSFDRNIERQAKNEKPLCKYFVAGNCDRGDNCRFSHENPKITNLEGRRCEFTDDHILHDKGNTWNDRGGNYRFSQENPRSSNLEGRRGEFTDEHSLRDKGNKTWNSPTWDDEARKPDIVPRENPKSTNLEGRRGEFTDDHNLRDKGNNTWNDPTWDEEARNPDIVLIENPKSTNLEGRQSEFIDDHNLRDTGNNNWNSPSWDDEARNPDMVPRGWNEPIGMDMTTTVDTISIRSDDKSWGEWTDNSLNREKKPSPIKEIGSYGTTDSFGKDTMSNEQEHLMLHPSQFNQAGISSQGQNRIHEDHTFSVTPLLHDVSPALHFQQQQPNKSDRGMNMPISNRSEGFSIDLNGLGTEMADPMQLQNHQEAVQQPIISKLNASRNFLYSLTSEQSSEMTNYPVTIFNPQVAPLANPNVELTNSFMNEESQKYAGIEVMSPWGTMSSNPINIQPDPPIVSFDRSNPMESGGDANEHCNNSLTRELEPNNQMHVKQSSALPIVGKEFDNSKVEHPRSSKLKQDDMVVDSVRNGGKKAINDESKEPKEKKVPKIVEGHGKIEENDANKDEKGMRLFKNSLIEFVKELLKPKWKEGKMSREVHKTIVKKVVEKVTTTIQADHVPKTQDKVEMYLSSSKPKLLKLVQAYVERCQKKDT